MASPSGRKNTICPERYIPVVSRFALVFSQLCSGSIRKSFIKHPSTYLNKLAKGTVGVKNKLIRFWFYGVGFALVIFCTMQNYI